MPCSTGLLDFEVAKAIGADPSPASLENNPFAIPFLMANLNVIPIVEPSTALAQKRFLQLTILPQGFLLYLKEVLINTLIYKLLP